MGRRRASRRGRASAFLAKPPCLGALPRWHQPVKRLDFLSKPIPTWLESEGIETIRGRMTLAFGAISFPVSRERGDAVAFLELLLAGGFAGTLGLLLALVWTAGFVPTFLEPSAASVLLAKPVRTLATASRQVFWCVGFRGVPGGALRRLDVAGPWVCEPMSGT